MEFVFKVLMVVAKNNLWVDNKFGGVSRCENLH